MATSGIELANPASPGMFLKGQKKFEFAASETRFRLEFSDICPID
jgi:hypothetical protein